MHCTHCPANTLVISERSGIELDRCPQCRGVWLDRGELDKLIERSLPSSDRENRDPSDRRPAPRNTSLRPRKSWLSEIFD